jgi:transposase-like protein
MAAAREVDFVDMALIVNIDEINVRGKRFRMCHRGTQDILVAVVDGLKGFPEGSSRSFPRHASRRASCT